MKFVWFGARADEIKAAADDLIVRHGADAYVEALRLADVARRMRAPKNKMLYRRVAHHIQVSRAASYGFRPLW